FAESLANCEFREYFIDLSWQSRSTAMTPLFSGSASGGSMAMSMTLDPSGGIHGNHHLKGRQPQQQTGMVKATFTPQFSVTQQAPSQLTYSSSVMSVLSDPSLSQTSLLFKPFGRGFAQQQ